MLCRKHRPSSAPILVQGPVVSSPVCQQGSVSLLASLPIISCLESLNKSLQGADITVSGMLAAVKIVQDELRQFRYEEKFSDIFKSAEEKTEQVNLTPLSVPRRRKLPKKLDPANTSTTVVDTAEQTYRIQFFTAIDAALANLKDQFESSYLAEYEELSNVLLHGASVGSSIINKYPELSESLMDELAFYRNHHAATTLEAHRIKFQSMEPSVRRMFPQVERLLRLLLVSPASSCEAERSFSALRRIKTWLRSTMTQQRLNHVMVCHIHKDKLAKIDSQQIADEFISRRADSRRKVFGKF